MKTKLLSVIYFLIGILYILLNGHSSFLTGLIIKSFIIPVLIIIFIINFRNTFNKLSALILAGLFFSWAGDIVLDFSFIPGLVCFLLAQVMYLIVFFLTPGENIIFHSKYFLLIPVVLYGTGLVYYLYDDLGDMKLPVIIYAFVILTMLAAAINRLKKVNKISYWLVLAGAILFVISDSVIAVNKFSQPIKVSSLIIMTTYITAQFLITLGFIRQYKEKVV
ncbi:MAG: lysoplasmalogenase [Bacteroidia bacterium]|jgi:uncharacterized membrane protein YhhN|nr:lysoplasmalogenase [Bacteroidia bacterium]